MPNRELQVLLLCPTGQDAFLIADALKNEKILSSISHSIDEVFSRKIEEIDIILIAEEALSPQVIERLNLFLQTQEPWSEIPVILLTSKGTRGKHFNKQSLEVFIYSGNVTLLERPLHLLTLLSTVKVAIRARKKQYQMRDLLIAQVAATNIRDEFISIASHELKTPLTSLKLQTQVARKLFQKNETVDRNRVFQQLDYTVNQINRLNKLVDDMLDISRITTGKLKLDKAVFDLSKLVRELVDRFSPQFEAVGCHVMASIEPEVTGAWDSFKIEQVINNLFSNAIRYAPKSCIEVTLKKENGVAKLTVKDGGQGIHPDSLEKIFERFERASTNASGLGLGLYITRQIIELHKGKIRAESELGKGSCFIIELPLKTES